MTEAAAVRSSDAEGRQEPLRRKVLVQALGTVVGGISLGGLGLLLDVLLQLDADALLVVAIAAALASIASLTLSLLTLARGLAGAKAEARERIDVLERSLERERRARERVNATLAVVEAVATPTWLAPAIDETHRRGGSVEPHGDRLVFRWADSQIFSKLRLPLPTDATSAGAAKPLYSALGLRPPGVIETVFGGGPRRG